MNRLIHNNKKSKKKSQWVWEWCPNENSGRGVAYRDPEAQQAPLLIHVLEPTYPSKRARRKRTKKFHRTQGTPYSRLAPAKKVRCTTCGKQFNPCFKPYEGFIFDDGNGYMFVPPHKRKVRKETK